jgi:FkbM family methyltransferase
MRTPALIRRVTDPVLERLAVPIIGGVNRGRWWNLASAGSGYASGRRASAQLQLFRALIRPGDCVWDVGAHHGYVTLAAARAAGTGGRVHAFEPGSRNRRILERHLAWNGVDNVTVHGCALGSADGEAHFGGSGTSRTQALGAGGEVVTVRTARTMVRQEGCCPPDVIKIDVEDAEAALLDGAMDVVPPDSVILAAMHSAASDARCSALLREAGFRCHPSAALRAARAGPWFGDPDLLCFGPAVPAARVRPLAGLLAAAGFDGVEPAAGFDAADGSADGSGGGSGR